MTYVVFRFNVSPPIKEESDDGMVIIVSSAMKGRSSMLEQNNNVRHKYADKKHMDRQIILPCPTQVRLMYGDKHVCVIW